MDATQWLFVALLVVICVVIKLLFHSSILKEGFNQNELLNGVDMVLWINLDRSQDRRERMEKNVLSDPIFEGKIIQRVPAIDGKNENMKNYVHGELNTNVTMVEYACTLSHIKAISTFAESDLPEDSVALIFEDDVTLELRKTWNKDLKTIMDHAPVDWEILQLCYFYFDGLKEKKTMYFNDQLFSAAAYLIKKSSAKKINERWVNKKYNFIPNVGIVADVYLYDNRVLKKYAYKYPIFIYPTEDWDSTLHPDHLPFHQSTKQELLKMFDTQQHTVE
jgi:GR25 family glycosyltransferase involved in LPS biosynthesis